MLTRRTKAPRSEQRCTLLRAGDKVMVMAGGNKNTRPLKGKVAKILRFEGMLGQRVVLEGLNMNTKHQRPRGPGKPGGKLQVEGSMHVSNVMYYVEKLKRPVKLRVQRLDDGKKVRGYLEPKSKKFEQIVDEKKS